MGEWCGPCRMVGPIVEELAKEYDGKVVIGKMDVDNNVDTPTEYGIRNIPTILFFQRRPIGRQTSWSYTKAALTSKVEALL